MSGLCGAEEGRETGFEIKTFEVTGNSIFSSDRLQEETALFSGPGKTAADVEKARDAVEKFYHDAGYPAVIVNIPEQTLKDGVVRLQVIESRIGRVTITGNRYFTMEKIRSELPSLSSGRFLYMPSVQSEIARLNRNPDFKVDPLMSPGQEFGTIDIELKVDDRLPLHGYLEINNRHSSDTSQFRLNGMLRYDNLWQKEHSLSIQYQTAPLKPSEVEVFGGSYSLPAPWNEDHQLALFGIVSDSNTVTFGEGFTMIGKGQIFGVRYVISLPQYKLYAHNITMGLDYKHSYQLANMLGSSEPTTTLVNYMPLTFSYNASLPDEWGGATQFSAGLNMTFRGLVSDEAEFEVARYKARAGYLYATFGIQRSQKLPWGMGLFAKVDGQVADQPLISNEQYSGGGMESVRAYLESEAMGDNAAHGTLEVSFPDPAEKFMPANLIPKGFQMSPFLFYDVARLITIDPLPGQDRAVTLSGPGVGVRGSLTKYFEYEMDWAIALHTTDKTHRDDQRIYVKLRGVL